MKLLVLLLHLRLIPVAIFATWPLSSNIVCTAIRVGTRTLTSLAAALLVFVPQELRHAAPIREDRLVAPAQLAALPSAAHRVVERHRAVIVLRDLQIRV